VLSRFPRGNGTLLDLEFLEDGMKAAKEHLTKPTLTVEQRTEDELLPSATYAREIDIPFLRITD
jgi:hypothetical protein